MDKDKIKIKLSELINEHERDLADGRFKGVSEEKTKDYIDGVFSVLGWDIKHDTEKEVLTGKRKRVDYTFHIGDSTKFLLEAKAYDVDLTEQEIKQALGYAYQMNRKWVVLSNYREIRVYNSQYYKEEEEIRRLFAPIKIDQLVDRLDDLWVLSRPACEQNLIDTTAQERSKAKIKEPIIALAEDLLQWRNILTKEMYNHPRLNEIYGKTDNQVIEWMDEAVQMLLNRFVFLRTVEDLGNDNASLKGVIRQWENSKKEPLMLDISRFFRDMERIYNSGLFEEHPIEKLTLSNEKLLEVINEMYDSKDKKIEWDFSALNKDQDVLGLAYEQYLGTTLSEPTKLRKTKEKKKKLGIYYTPKYIVEYIVKNTLGKKLRKCKNLNEILKIRVLDPACGSGSFLKEAYRTFKEELRSRDLGNQRYLDEETGKQISVYDWILKYCIYGVDLDKKACEIAKLNLLLLAAEGETHRLPDIDRSIQNGNSLIDDESFIMPSLAFKWDKRFPEIFDSDELNNKGFDVIIGNPPYIRVQNLKHEEIDWYKKHMEVAYKRVDISILFIELANRLLKKYGLVGYVSSNQFILTEYGRKIREFILKKYNILQIIDYGGLPIFENAITYVSIFIFENSKGSKFKYLKIKDLTAAMKPDLSSSIDISYKGLSDEPWVLSSKDELRLINTLNSTQCLEKIGGTWAGIITGADEVLMLTQEKIEKFRLEKEIMLPLIRGKDPQRYQYIKPSKYVIYPYKSVGAKTMLLEESELSERYPKCYQYLLDNKSILMRRKDSRRNFANKSNWFGLVRFGRKDIFNKIKIVTPGEVKNHKFGIDISKSGFSCARVFAITIDNPEYKINYILAILNSQLIRFYLQHIAPLKQGGFYTYSSTILSQVPIMKIDMASQDTISMQVDELLSSDKNAHIEREKIERHLNKIIYGIYNITEDDQKVIEGHLKY